MCWTAALCSGCHYRAGSQVTEKLWKIIENYGKLWKIMENYGKLWKTIENWKTMENYGKLLKDKVAGN